MLLKKSKNGAIYSKMKVDFSLQKATFATLNRAIQNRLQHRTHDNNQTHSSCTHFGIF
jgi:hypothetical protein